MSAPSTLERLAPSDTFVHRHLGPREHEIASMLATVGATSLDELTAATVPASIRTKTPLRIGPARGEHELLAELRALASKNRVLKSYLGLGYHACITPPVILRNLFENPGWYTQYTPYQAEISQGRLESLLNFQTLIADLTGLPIANASVLDEATAAAEAMHMCAATGGDKTVFFVDQGCHPQTIDVVRTRAKPLGIEVTVGDPATFDYAGRKAFGALLQTPATDGRVIDATAVIQSIHAAGAMAVVATDLLALLLMKTPAEMGADVAIGSAQRFGVPLGYGGPHAGFMATKDEHKRQLPGRIIGVSRDAKGKPALRLSMQTREQHIRREKATSNICTAQALLANMAAMYAVYHGPKGLRRIAERVHAMACVLAAGAQELGHKVAHADFFDTVRVELVGRTADEAVAAALALGINLRKAGPNTLVIAMDETVTTTNLADLLSALAGTKSAPDVTTLAARTDTSWPTALARTSATLEHEVWNRYHSETELMRYMRRLEGKDLALNHSMISLGSCTMKLNAVSEMLPVSWPEFGQLHPFAPRDQAQGYAQLFTELESMIADVTGFPAVSLQPNAGSQGEYAGLLVIQRYHEERGQAHRNVCLIPASAHGTNPASAVMAGMQVVVVACDAQGNIDVADLRAKAKAHEQALACLMVTYPSTHGVFEESIQEICKVVHAHGGQVYMDGANMNAQVGLARPAEIGADVCHLNLHKTFAIPHGGGGPGVGPIGVAAHLAAYLPGHPLVSTGRGKSVGAVSAAPWGSASILPISWMYMKLMGSEGLKRATEVAILNANYMAKQLEPHYPILYKGARGRVAHEFILDLRPFKATAGIEAEDVAKRLMDFGFHAPTMSFPVPGTLMIEPTESESKAELDRFCEAMIAIKKEIQAIERGELDKLDNPLKHAPHTAEMIAATEWNHGYRREQAAYPVKSLRADKYWPPVARVDNAWGDRNFVCTCPPIESYSQG